MNERRRGNSSGKDWNASLGAWPFPLVSELFPNHGAATKLQWFQIRHLSPCSERAPEKPELPKLQPTFSEKRPNVMIPYCYTCHLIMVVTMMTVLSFHLG